MPEDVDRYSVALGVLAATPAALTALLEPLPAALWDWSPAPGEWTPHQTLTHMLSVDTIIIPVRVRAMLAEDGAPMPKPGAEAPIAPPAETLRAWRAAREENLAFVRGLTPEQLARGAAHRHYGRITAREHIIEWAYHDLDHLRALQATVEACLYPEIGGFQALYSKPFPVSE